MDHISQHCVLHGLMDGERSLVTQSYVWRRILGMTYGTNVMWKTGHKEYLDATRSMRREQRMLTNLGQGERDGVCSDYVAQHLGELVAPLPVTPLGDRILLRFH